MEYSDLDLAVHERRSRNASKNVVPKGPLRPLAILTIRFFLDEHKRLRNRATSHWQSTANCVDAI